MVIFSQSIIYKQQRRCGLKPAASFFLAQWRAFSANGSKTDALFFAEEDIWILVFGF
jgi:hypothetical protein